MKASELVKMLDELIAADGDLPVTVMVSDGEGGHTDGHCTNVVRCAGDDGKVKSFLLAERETELAFS